ncbi:MAG TPA: universal stress protein [Desulfuromonadales bacterium]|nr:universal stress protein [Desulfuromonadales bacterium]
MKKVMLAADCSAHSKLAAEYLGRVAPHVPDCQVVLFSVTTGIPYSAPPTETPFLDSSPGEVHGDEDHREEMKQVETFLSDIRTKFEERGLDRDQVTMLVKPLRQGIAQDILTEALDCECDTIVVGRRGFSRVKEVLLGSVSNDLVHKATGLTVWVVG